MGDGLQPDALFLPIKKPHLVGLWLLEFMAVGCGWVFEKNLCISVVEQLRLGLL